MQCFKTYGYRFKTVRFSKIGNVINYIILIFKFDFFSFYLKASIVATEPRAGRF